MKSSGIFLVAFLGTLFVGTLQDNLDCNFDGGNLCSWVNNNAAPIAWGSTVAQYNGWTGWANTDHTTNSMNGRYAYLLTYYAKQNQHGDLVSPEMTATNASCLTFWYNMLQTTGSMEVYLQKTSDSSKQTVFVRNGNQGGRWLKGRVSISMNAQYKIIIRHTKGSLSTETGLAVDDIKFTEGACSSTLSGCGKNKLERRAMTSEEEEEDLARRIIQGQASPQGQWPWIVHIRTFPLGSDGGYMQCGGSLIDRGWVVTAAHCFETEGGRVTDGNKVVLYFGEANVGYGVTEDSQFSLKAAEVIFHPDRTSGSHRFDIALIKLPYDLTLNDNVNTVCLPDAAASVGSPCIAAGWGLDSTGSTTKELKHINMKVLEQTSCGTLADDQLCAIADTGYGDVCRGDSGGPLVFKNTEKNNTYELLGAVSFGSYCSEKNRTPGVYADIYHFKSWIETTIDN